MTSEGSSAARRRPGSGSGGPATAKEAEAEEAGAAPAPPPPQRQWRPSGSAGPCPAPRRCWGSPGATGSMLLNFTGTTVSGRVLPDKTPSYRTGLPPQPPPPRAAGVPRGAAPPREGTVGRRSDAAGCPAGGRRGARARGGRRLGPFPAPPLPPLLSLQRRGRVRCPVRGPRERRRRRRRPPHPGPGARERRGAGSACPSSCNPGHGARRGLSRFPEAGTSCPRFSLGLGPGLGRGGGGGRAPASGKASPAADSGSAGPGPAAPSGGRDGTAGLGVSEAVFGGAAVGERVPPRAGLLLEGNGLPVSPTGALTEVLWLLAFRNSIRRKFQGIRKKPRSDATLPRR